MSILIKGVDLPKDIDELRLIINGMSIAIEPTQAKQIPTPHGRLIDKDELLSHIKKDPLFSLVERYGVSGVIESRPTILEEEK